VKTPQNRRRSEFFVETSGRSGWHLECQPGSQGRGKSPLADLLGLLLGLLLHCYALVAHLYGHDASN